METPLATVEHRSCKAEIYETQLPGQFSVRYYHSDGTVMAEEPLSGVSSYKQREQEIIDRMDQLCQGHPVQSAALSDSGEY